MFSQSIRCFEKDIVDFNKKVEPGGSLRGCLLACLMEKHNITAKEAGDAINCYIGVVIN